MLQTRWRQTLVVGVLFLGRLAQPQIVEMDDTLPFQWSLQFAREVDHRLDVPLDYQQRAVALMSETLIAAGLADLPTQAFVVVDRSPQIQAAYVVLREQAGGWHWIGATSVSTGKPGSFAHFYTPLGAFEHTLDNPDFRAEGTFNKNHIRGYGVRGRRVFDFGWRVAERGWGNGGSSSMRLQMHATDPHVLEQRLGSVASEGCVRIPATLNAFLDKNGILDAAYEEALARGQALWIIKPGRRIVPWPGRYMVVIDSQAVDRPAWSPLPAFAQR